MKIAKSSEGYIMMDIVISKIDKQKHFIDFLILLNILYIDARAKDNRTIYASNKYLMGKVKWGSKKLIKCKRELENLKIIKIVHKQMKIDAFQKKQYITLLHMKESDKITRNEFIPLQNI